LNEDVATIRIASPCDNAGDFLGRIVVAIGLEPKELGVADLESVLEMFLSFQEGHARRTVIGVEQVQDCGWWVLDKIQWLVDLAAAGNPGLMVVVSGQPDVKTLLHTRPLSSVAERAGQSICVSPLTPAETREYIRRRVEAGGTTSIDQAFQFQAITLIHELSKGVPDAVSALVSTCFDQAERERVDLVTTNIVSRSHEIQRTNPAATLENNHADTVTLSGEGRRNGRLIVKVSGEDIREMAVRQGHLLIGRGKQCDLRLGSPGVSRQHALISYTQDGAVLTDLRSTNGTFVDGRQVSRHVLEPGETIGVGDCRIEYILEDPGMSRFASGGDDRRKS
jgi:type II secretory pathway predicted ATPase ExeA